MPDADAGAVTADLGIGANLGDRLAALQSAVDALADTAGVTLVAVSAVYETEPVGGPEQDAFLNACVRVATTLDPGELLAVAHQIEAAAHRVRTVRWGPRTLDVDVLRFGDVVSDDPALTLPHPRLFERAFVLVPLADIDPGVAAAAAQLDTAGVVRTDHVLAHPTLP